MAADNLSLAREMYGAFNRRDWAALVGLADNEILSESRLMAIEGEFRGHDGLRRWWDSFLGAFPDYEIEVDELREIDAEFTLAHIRGGGHGGASSAPLVDPFWQPMEWRGGKCTWWRNCPTEAEALAAVEERRS